MAGRLSRGSEGATGTGLGRKLAEAGGKAGSDRTQWRLTPPREGRGGGRTSQGAPSRPSRSKKTRGASGAHQSASDFERAGVGVKQ